MVEICYSEALAKAKQDFKRAETALSVLALAGASAAVGVIFGGLISGVALASSSLYATFTEFGVKAAFMQLGGVAANVFIADKISGFIDGVYDNVKQARDAGSVIGHALSKYPNNTKVKIIIIE